MAEQTRISPASATDAAPNSLVRDEHGHPPASATHSHAINVVENDIDFMGHANNAVYLNWVQDAVIAHWRRVADPVSVAGHVWVALKHEISYRKPAFLGDAIVATVILEQVRGASAFYESVIMRGDAILADVKSRWCCLDATTLRPARLGRDIVQLFFPAGDEVAV